MRLKVRHATSYAYSRPARSAIQMLRMTPRSSDSQFIKRWRVEIDADARLETPAEASAETSPAPTTRWASTAA